MIRCRGGAPGQFPVTGLLAVPAWQFLQDSGDDFLMGDVYFLTQDKVLSAVRKSFNNGANFIIWAANSARDSI